MELHLKIKEYNELINSKLEEYLPEKDVAQKTIYDAARYSLFAGGKRIRPVLMLAVTEMLDGDIRDTIPFACAMEMVHTFSLIHDDLPAIDNDDYRRGRLTNHKVFNEGVAVLAGDALLNRAYEVIASTFKTNTIIDRKIRALQEIASAIGIEGMIAGELIDIESEGKKIDEDALRNMHALKTGKLIIASALIGAIIAGASDEDIEKVRLYAQNVGLAFQIKDDILSEIGDEKKLGKKVGNDREMNKSTYVTILGIEEAERQLKETTDNAIKALEGYGVKSEFLTNLADYLLRREN